ncbi:MAG: glycosyltransferase, partial [Bacteroidales bacterium]|nr:glycosyltransferase [Bacteroidales bacterium]
MKIALLSFYSGSINRGVESVVYELANRLAKKHDITVFQSAKNDFMTLYKVRVVDTKIDFDKKDSTGSLSRKLFLDYWSKKIGLFSIGVLKSVIKEKYDVVVTFNGGWQPAIMRIAT